MDGCLVGVVAREKECDMTSQSVPINGFGVLFVILNSFGLASGFRSATCWERCLPIGRLPCLSPGCARVRVRDACTHSA